MHYFAHINCAKGVGKVALDQRSTAILNYLIQASTYVPVKELTERFHISRRTIYYDIEKISDWLKDNDLPPIKHVRSAGFYLEEEAAVQIPEKLGTLKEWHYEYTAKERKGWLAIYLMARDAPLFLGDLMEKLRVSRNTTIDDLKALKEELGRFQLILEFDRKQGYIILGNEDDKRKAIAHYLQLVLPDQSWQTILRKIPYVLQNHTGENLDLFDFEKLKAVQMIVEESEKELNIKFTDEFLEHFPLQLLFFYKRLSKGKKVCIDPVEKEVLQETRQFQAAQKIAAKLSALFQTDFPEDEILYITKHLLGSRIQFADESATKSYGSMKKAVAHMVSDFQKYACVFFENRQEIERNLLLHVKPAYYRVKYGLEFENEMTKAIKENYHDIFIITRKVMYHLEQLTGKEVNDDETALIAMHFGGWMKKVGAQPALRKTALIVCTNGIGTSRLLQHQLEGLFSTIDIIGCVSLREYENQHFDADFIISTIPLEEKDRPVFIVSPILTEAEKENLLKKINSQLDENQKQSASVEALMDIIHKYADIRNESGLLKELKQHLAKSVPFQAERPKPSLGDLLTKENILFKENVGDWEEAIKIASEPLRSKGYIADEYVEAMIKNIKTMGPYIVIAPKIAIPHAKPEDGVHQLGMSLLKLGKPVLVMGKEVQVFIVLAAIDGDSHIKAVSQLNNLLSDKGQLEKLLTAPSLMRITEQIKIYSE